MSYVISDEEVRGGVPIRSFLNACQNPRVGGIFWRWFLTCFWTFERYEFIISITNMDSLAWWIALGINHVYVALMISFTSKLSGSSWTRHKRASCFSERKDLISYLVETFDGRDRHVLSSLLVFLRECNRICKSDDWVSESRSSRGTATGSYLLLVRFRKYGLKHASDYYTDRGRYSRDGRISAKYSPA